MDNNNNNNNNNSRTRESRRSSSSSMPSTTNAFPRRRHPTISLRGSSQEEQVELQETVRLRAKRRRGSHHSHSHSTEEESVGNEQDCCDLQDGVVSRMLSPNNASSASDQNHHRTFTPLRPTPPPPSKITDEIIGATVPKKARSASVKRTHEEQSLQSAEAASPSYPNVKKMKLIGPETRLPNTSKSSSLSQEDIEIEIAELLFGLKTSKNHEPSSEKPDTDADKKKVEDYSSSTLAPNNSTAESVRIETEKPVKVEKPLSESARVSDCHDDNASGHEIGSSECPKEDNDEDNSNSGAGCGVTADGRSEFFTGESLSSCSNSKLDVDKQYSCSTRAMSDVPGANGQRVDKFEIDLMAPPPMMLSPERDNLSRGEDSVKVEDMVEKLVKKEKAQEETEEVKMDAFKEKWDVIKLDLEKPNKHNDIATKNELEEQDRSKEQPAKSTNHKVEKTVQSSSVSLSTAVPERPSSLSSLGYMPPLQTVVKAEKTTGSSTAPLHVNFVLSQPPPKRCGTHHYIARNIFLHQQCTKMNPFLPSAVGSGSVCDAKPNNVNRLPSAESMVVGKQSQKHSLGANQNTAQEKGWAATSDYSLAAIKSSGPANPMDSTQMKQLVLQQGPPHPGSTCNIVHGPAFLFPPQQHQASVTTATSQAGGVNSTSSASSSNKSHSSAAGSLGTSSTLPAVAAAMSFSYPNLSASDTPYVTIVQNSGYPFPFSTPLGASAAIRGASPAQATPILNGPLYSSQMFHPLHSQQHPHSQALVQPSYLNASTSSDSSSSHKQSQGTQVNGNNILTSTTMQLQQPQKQHTSLSRKHETGMAGENASSVASGTAYSQKNVFGQNYTNPVQPMNLSFRPSATSDSVGGNGGNFGEKQQQQQTLKGGVERIPSQAFAISFAAFNGSIPSNLNFSSMAQSPVIFQSLPDIAWQGCQAAGTSHTTQQKIYSITEGKNGGNSSHQDDEKKATSGKPSTNGPTTLVFDNSSKNLNFVSSSPMNGNWPSRSITSTATATSLPLSSNASNSQQTPQLLHLQQPHGMLQQQPAMATRYKASSTNATTASKFVSSPPVFSQTFSSNQASQSKNSGRTPDSQVHNTSIITSTTPTLRSFSQEQGRVLQGHTQISFGGNYISSLPPQGQHLLNNNQPFGTTVTGTPPNGANLKANSQGSKVSSSTNTSQMQQTENSSAGTGQKSSPVCGRNVPSILSSCPSHLSELKY